MDRTKSPQQKKAESYAKDFRPWMEYPHAFRAKWRKKKTRGHRAERAGVRALLVDATELTAGEVKSVRRGGARAMKGYVMTLRERIEWNKRMKERLKGRKVARDQKQG